MSGAGAYVRWNPGDGNGAIFSITNTLIEGDLFDPQDGDVILQQGRLKAGEPIPAGDWRVLTGNQFCSSVARVVLRYEIAADYPDFKLCGC